MFISSGYSAHTRRVRSATEDHHGAAHVLVGGRDLDPPARAQPHRGALGLQGGGVEAIESDDVILDVETALGGDRLPPALEHELVVAHADRGRPAAVDDAVDLPDVREGTERRLADVKRLEPVGKPDGQDPPRGGALPPPAAAAG